MIVSGGIIGGTNSSIRVNGKIFSSFIRNANIVCKGDILANQLVNAEIACNDRVVVLEGTDATVYSNALIKVELVSGPSTPKITAKDTSGIEHNIMELGYWGPPEGFAVGNTFKNETPVVATYNDPGTYVIRLSLIDKNSSDRVIVSQEFTQVVETAPVNPEPSENTVVNETNNVVEEIPQTGTSIWTYLVIIVAIACVIYGGNLIIKKQK